MTFCLNFVGIEDSAIEGGGECNTPILTSFALNIYDTYIVNNHGEELKAKAPPIDLVMLCIGLEWSPMVYRDIWHILNCDIM